jgi:hypothetical protein
MADMPSMGPGSPIVATAQNSNSFAGAVLQAGELPPAPCPIFLAGLSRRNPAELPPDDDRADLIATSVGSLGSSKASARRRIGGCAPTGATRAKISSATFQDI